MSKLPYIVIVEDDLTHAMRVIGQMAMYYPELFKGDVVKQIKPDENGYIDVEHMENAKCLQNILNSFLVDSVESAESRLNELNDGGIICCESGQVAAFVLEKLAGFAGNIKIFMDYELKEYQGKRHNGDWVLARFLDALDSRVDLAQTVACGKLNVRVLFDSSEAPYNNAMQAIVHNHQEVGDFSFVETACLQKPRFSARGPKVTAQVNGTISNMVNDDLAFVVPSPTSSIQMSNNGIFATVKNGVVTHSQGRSQARCLPQDKTSADSLALRINY